MLVAGVDIGSMTAKVVLFEDGKIISSSVNSTGADCNKAAEKSLSDALKKIGKKKEDIKYTVATGYGRRAIDFGDESITEISANAKGAVFLGSEKGQIRSIIDIGGQDTKAIILDDKGKITNFIMNDKCAAGTGRFLDVISNRVFEVPIEKFIELSLKSKNEITINSTCTVFAESEVISLIAKKVPKEDIAAGLHKAIAKKIADLAKSAGVSPIVFFDGGGSKNIALKKHIEDELGYEVYVPKVDPQTVVALGAALFAYEKATKKGKK
jgi:(R)-2-hydroxyacyl-CoA dehydratese activating ATPase